MKKYFLSHQVRNGMETAYEKVTLDMIAAAREERHLRSIDLFREADTWGRYTLLENSFDEARYQDHLAGEAYTVWRAAIEEGEMLVHEDRRMVASLAPTPAKDAALGPDASVSLRLVDEDNVRAVINLAVTEFQNQFVAPNVHSLAQAYAAGEGAWVRAIYAGETPVGFVMLSVNAEKPRYYLWRYMVDARYQGSGYGKQALDLVIEHVRSQPGATEMFLSYVPGEGSPRGFYEKLGFRDTGVEHGGELEMRLGF